MVANCRLKITSERLRTLKGQTKHKAIAETVFTFRSPRALPSLCLRLYSRRPADWEDLQAILRSHDVIEAAGIQSTDKGRCECVLNTNFNKCWSQTNPLQDWERHKKTKIENMVYERLTRKSKIIESQKCEFV